MVLNYYTAMRGVGQIHRDLFYLTVSLLGLPYLPIIYHLPTCLQTSDHIPLPDGSVYVMHQQIPQQDQILFGQTHLSNAIPQIFTSML